MTLRNTNRARCEYGYTCCVCGVPYVGRREVADVLRRHCSDRCKLRKHREAKAAGKAEAKLENQLASWLKSHKGGAYIRKCRDAGSVQVMQGHNCASLLELDALFDRLYKCYGWSHDEKKSAFHICHIQPHKGRDGSLGCLHPANLFIGDAGANQAQGAKAVPSDAGASVPAHELDRKWNVSPSDSDEVVARKIRRLLGKEFNAYLLAGPIKLSTHNARARRVYNKQGTEREVNKLDHYYTRGELEALLFEELEALEAHQTGKEGVERFQPDRYTRATLCVYADELARLGQSLPDGRHRDNCLFMLPLVRVLGMYTAQGEDVLVRSHRSFLSLPNATWRPLQHNRSLFFGTNVNSYLARDFQYMRETILQGAYDAMQGLAVSKHRFQDHIHKRLNIEGLVPVVLAPDAWSWKANGESWDQYISNLYGSFEPVWQSLVDVGLCTADEIKEARIGVLWSLQAAIEKARHQYRNQSRFKRWHMGTYHKRWGWKGYPEYLDYPAAVVELFTPGPCADDPCSSHQEAMCA